MARTSFTRVSPGFGCQLDIHPAAASKEEDSKEEAKKGKHDLSLQPTSATTLREGERAVICRLHGYAGPDEYYAACEPALEAVLVPWLCVHARDDPVISAAPVAALAARLSAAKPEWLFALTRTGGHLGYAGGGATSWPSVPSWADEMAAQRYGWVRTMSKALGEPPKLREAYCCTQFIVSADRIRRRPLSFWRRLLADLLDTGTPPVCKVSGHVLELTWGYMLGEPANATCRTDGWGTTAAQSESPASRRTRDGARPAGRLRQAASPRRIVAESRLGEI